MSARLTSSLLGGLLLVGLSSIALSQDDKVPADKAVIIVKLPADAKLTIDGEATKATGARRKFSASGLEAGKRYAYTLVATWKQDGKDQTETKRVRFRSGETVEVVLGEKKADPPKDKDKDKAKADLAKKMQAAYDVAMKDAKAAMDGKKYDAAIKAYDAALKAKPGDKAAADGKAAAVKAKDDAKEAEKKADLAKKMQAAYDAAMKDAKSALEGKKYDDAIKAYDAALKAKPGDKAASDGKAAAVKAKDDAKEAEKKAEEARKMQAAYDVAMKDAKAAMDGKKYDAAIKAYGAALKAKPGDKVATDGKSEAVKAQDAAKKEAEKKAEEAKKMQAAYDVAIKDARSALEGKKYDAAIKAFDAALKAKPDDKTATDGKAAAVKAKDLARKEEERKKEEEKKKEDERKKEEEKKKAEDDKKAKAETDYKAAIATARSALKDKKFADAIKAYEAALKVKPGDKAAEAGKSAAEAEAKKSDDKKADETLPPPLTEKTGASKGAKSRSFTFTYEATVTGLEKGKKAKVWVPVAQSTEAQDVKLLSHTVKSGEEKPEGKFGTEKQYGNRMYFVETTPDDAGKVALAFTYQVTRREVKGEMGAKLAEDADKIKRFLQADTLVPIDGKPLDLLEGKTLPDDPMKKARLLYDVVNEHMKYSKEGKEWGRGDSVWACDSKFGNCSDFHSLFISLSRSQKIPAKFEMGFPLPTQRGDGAIGGYHCWAFFKPEGKQWVPVDISEANKDPKLKDYYFGNLTEDRVGFTTGRDIDLEPKQAGKPVNFLIYPHVEVNGAVHDQAKIEKKFSYRDAK